MQNEQAKFNCERAIYSEQVITRYQGNPLIEALPDIIDSPKLFVKAVSFSPEITEEDRELSAIYRAHLIDSIQDFFKPLSFHIELEQKISRMIRNGYVNRNPYRGNLRRNIEGVKYGVKETDSSTVAELGIFGVSGMGKTTLINKVLSLYPQLILHTNYKGDKTVRYQIPWLKVEIPAGCRIKSLSLDILKQIDNLFGEENYYKKGNAKKEYEQVPYLQTVFDIHSVGLLIIDEIQNIRGMANKDSENIMKFFVQLSNVINVPIILVGTLKALPLFTTEMKNCRRIADSKPMYNLENGEEWKAFMKALFKLQWTRNPVEATDKIMDTLYEESQGITDIAIKLFSLAQLRAMYTKEERITPGIIKSVASDSLIPLRPLLDAIRSNNEKLLMKYEDLYNPKTYFKPYINQEKNKVSIHERSMVKDAEMERDSVNEFHILKGIASFLIQAGFDIKISEKNAKEVIRSFGEDIDLNILKRHAYELTAFAKPTQEDISDAVGNENVPVKKKTSNSGMLKIFDKSGEENVAGYEALKVAEFIGSEDEFI